MAFHRFRLRAKRSESALVRHLPDWGPPRHPAKPRPALPPSPGSDSLSLWGRCGRTGRELDPRLLRPTLKG